MLEESSQVVRQVVVVLKFGSVRWTGCLFVSYSPWLIGDDGMGDERYGGVQLIGVNWIAKYGKDGGDAQEI